MARTTYSTTLLEKTPRVGDIVSFTLERPAGYDFKAGQWFVLTFSQSEAEPWEHHFSHSNAPSESTLEFTTRLRGTPFKDALDRLPVGAEVQIDGPYGSFVVPPDVERAVFITGGIGITSVRSILREAAAEAEMSSEGGSNQEEPTKGEPTLKDVVLLFANRSEEGIPFKEELDTLAERLPLRVVHVLSRPEGEWTGHRGHIDQEVLATELGSPDGWTFWLSGPPAMVDDMRRLLLDWGADAAAVKAERFDGY